MNLLCTITLNKITPTPRYPMTHVWRMPFPMPPPAPEFASLSHLSSNCITRSFYFLSSCQNPRGGLLVGDGGDISGTTTSMTHGIYRECFPFSPRSGSCSSPSRHVPHAPALPRAYACGRRPHWQHVSTDVTYGHALNFWNLFTSLYCTHLYFRCLKNNGRFYWMSNIFLLLIVSILFLVYNITKAPSGTKVNIGILKGMIDLVKHTSR